MAMKTTLSIVKTRLTKTALVLIIGVLAAQKASTFSGTGVLLGFQTAAFDYGATRAYYPFPAGGELGGPQIIYNNARMNVGVVTYAYDPTFVAYFGTAGMSAVDSAMGVLNSLPKFTDYSSPSLAGYLTQGNQRLNYTAQALELMDLKSATLGLLVERMGLLGETHVFDLTSKSPLASPPNPPGKFQYTMVMRNYDPDTLNPSAYVNGAKYSFMVQDDGAVADAIETFNDTTVLPFSTTAVATRETLNLGGYYLGLTRDDVGGLRYLYNNKRIENETMDPTCYPQGSGSGSPWAPAEGTNTPATGGFTGLLGGVGKITFARVSYGSVIGNTFGTNVAEFTIPVLTNGLVSTMSVMRTNTAPDIVFAAADLSVYAAPQSANEPLYTRNMAFTAAPADPAGGLLPSTITPTGVTITFNSAGPLYYNLTPTTVAQDFVQIWNWGTFASGTNVIIYPQHQDSVTALEAAANQGGGGIPDTFAPAVNTNSPVSQPIIYQQP
jgi:hypothetical protein